MQRRGCAGQTLGEGLDAYNGRCGGLPEEWHSREE